MMAYTDHHHQSHTELNLSEGDFQVLTSSLNPELQGHEQHLGRQIITLPLPEHNHHHHHQSLGPQYTEPGPAPPLSLSLTGDTLISEPAPVTVTDSTEITSNNSQQTDIKPIKRCNKKPRSPNTNQPATHRFQWNKEMMQVAMNLLKYGCKPKIISVAVGCSMRTAQKFAETVRPRGDGESYREYVLRRRGRKGKDTNLRLEYIREVLNNDCTKTQSEIAANLKVSNTTICRDLKRLGNEWRDKRVRNANVNNDNNTATNNTNGARSGAQDVHLVNTGDSSTSAN